MTNGTLNLAQAAEALAVSTRTLRRLIAEGALSATKVERGHRQVWALDPAEITRYAESRGTTVQVAAVDPAGTRQTVTERRDSPGQEAALLAAVAADRDFLRQRLQAQEAMLQAVLRALPPAREETPVDAWRDYARALEQWQRLSWWKRRRTPRPVPPEA